MARVAYLESTSFRATLTTAHAKYTLLATPARWVPSQSSTGWLVRCRRKAGFSHGMVRAWRKDDFSAFESFTRVNFNSAVASNLDERHRLSRNSKLRRSKVG